MENNLKPCPFCGGTAIVENSKIDCYFAYTEFDVTVKCTCCGANINKKWIKTNHPLLVSSNADTVYDLWNRRVNNGSNKNKQNG